MKVKRFLLLIALESLFVCFVVNGYGQTQTIVVEARISAVDPGPTYHVEIEKVRRGEDIGRELFARTVEGKEMLDVGLRKFQHQRWLMTLVKDPSEEGAFQIRAAFGLGMSDLSSQKQMETTIPLVAPREELEHQTANPFDRAAPGAEEQSVVELTNTERWNNGMLPPYKQNDQLHAAADGHSQDMESQNFFAHCNLVNGDSPWDRIAAAGYSMNAAAENIAAGQTSPASVVGGWMNSAGHRANILSSSYREIGVGYDYAGGGPVDDRDANGDCVEDATGGPYGHYWTQNFGMRNNVYPVVIERELASTSSATVDLYVYGPGGATSMRFRNESGSWSSWVSYTPDYTWVLSSGAGDKTVYSEVSTGAGGSGSVYSASDEIYSSAAGCETMTFSNETLSGASTYVACEIIADPNVTIVGNITFEADNVTLDGGVEVNLGATLEISNP